MQISLRYNISPFEQKWTCPPIPFSKLGVQYFRKLLLHTRRTAARARAASPHSCMHRDEPLRNFIKLRFPFHRVPQIQRRSPNRSQTQLPTTSIMPNAKPELGIALLQISNETLSNLSDVLAKRKKHSRFTFGSERELVLIDLIDCDSRERRNRR